MRLVAARLPTQNQRRCARSVDLSGSSSGHVREYNVLGVTDGDGDQGYGGSNPSCSTSINHTTLPVLIDLIEAGVGFYGAVAELENALGCTSQHPSGLEHRKKLCRPSSVIARRG
jgi:hypothetical protein